MYYIIIQLQLAPIAYRRIYYRKVSSTNNMIIIIIIYTAARGEMRSVSEFGRVMFCGNNKIYNNNNNNTLYYIILLLHTPVGATVPKKRPNSLPRTGRDRGR